MESKVLHKTAVVTEDGGLCYCDGDFYRTCPIRLLHGLDCHEVIMTLVSVDREEGQLFCEEYNCNVIRNSSLGPGSGLDKVIDHFTKILGKNR